MAATYEFRVRGHLGRTMLQAFPDLDAKVSGNCTLLRGTVADQAALHGVLAQIASLRLELLEFHQLTQD
jgi:hypothetical protein